MLLERHPWYVAGPLLGLVIVGLRATLSEPLGALAGYIDLAQNASKPVRIGFLAFVLLGFGGGGLENAVAANRRGAER